MKTSNRTYIQGFALGLATRFAGSEFAEKYRLREPANKIAYTGTKVGFQAILQAARPFTKSNNKAKGTRLPYAQAPALFDLNLTEEQQMIRESVQRFSREEVRPVAYEADKNAATPAALFEQFPELGLNYLSVAEEQGGAATVYDPMTGALIAEDLAHGDFSIAYALLAPMAVANAISRWGDQGQQETYLASFVDEKPPKAAIAIQENHVLFDPTKLGTVAKSSGAGYVLNGQKAILPLAGEAEIYLVAAQLNDQPRVFIVEAGTPGLSWAHEPAMGLKAAQTGTLILENVSLPPSALLGGADFDYQSFLDLGQLHWCAMAVGTCQAVLDYVTTYANERKAFGEPISHRQSVAFMIANIAIELDAMRMLTWRACSLAQQGEDFHKAAFLARQLCAEKSMEIGTNGVQLLGGHGFTKEHPVERWYRDLRAMALMHGLHL
jgi:alkylation response protein AidB-like acyl-CoA dehydrogenase